MESTLCGDISYLSSWTSVVYRTPVVYVFDWQYGFLFSIELDRIGSMICLFFIVYVVVIALRGVKASAHCEKRRFSVNGFFGWFIFV